MRTPITATLPTTRAATRSTPITARTPTLLVARTPFTLLLFRLRGSIGRESGRHPKQNRSKQSKRHKHHHPPTPAKPPAPAVSSPNHHPQLLGPLRRLQKHASKTPPPCNSPPAKHKLPAVQRWIRAPPPRHSSSSCPPAKSQAPTPTARPTPKARPPSTPTEPHPQASTPTACPPPKAPSPSTPTERGSGGEIIPVKPESGIVVLVSGGGEIIFLKPESGIVVLVLVRFSLPLCNRLLYLQVILTFSQQNFITPNPNFCSTPPTQKSPPPPQNFHPNFHPLKAPCQHSHRQDKHSGISTPISTPSKHPLQSSQRP